MKRRYILIISIILFFITLYWIQYSPWSSSELAKYNNGYGTFDMKSYNPGIVYEVLDHTEPQGFTVYQEYFIVDYLFIINLAILQIILLLYGFSWLKSKLLLGLLFAAPIARGIFDAVENTLLFYVLRTYPQKHDSVVNLSHIATSLKLGFVNISFFLIIAGFIVKLIIGWKKRGKML